MLTSVSHNNLESGQKELSSIPFCLYNILRGVKISTRVTIGSSDDTLVSPIPLAVSLTKYKYHCNKCSSRYLGNKLFLSLPSLLPQIFKATVFEGVNASALFDAACTRIRTAQVRLPRQHLLQWTTPGKRCLSTFGDSGGIAASISPAFWP